MESYFLNDDLRRDEELYRMFQLLLKSPMNGDASPETDKLRPECTLFALQVCYGPSIAPDNLKALVLGPLLPEGLDLSSLSHFEVTSMFDSKARAHVTDFDAFAASFDDVPLAKTALAALTAALVERKHLDAAAKRVFDDEAACRKFVVDEEMDLREDLNSSYRRSRDVALLRDQIHAAGLRHKREARLQDLLDGSIVEGSAQVTASLAALRSEAAQTKAQTKEYLEAATRFEEAAMMTQAQLQTASEQLPLLRKWTTTALNLARQQVEEGLTDVVAIANSRRPFVETELDRLETRLDDLTSAIVATAAERDPAALRRFMSAGTGRQLGNAVQGHWENAAAHTLDSPQLALCDPANVNPQSADALSDHLTSTLVWTFLRYARTDGGALWQSPLPTEEEVRGRALSRSQFDRFLSDHALEVPGTRSLFFDEFSSRPGSPLPSGMEFSGFVRALHFLAQMMHGHRGHRYSMPFALHCLVQTSIECRQDWLIMARVQEKSSSSLTVAIRFMTEQAGAFAALERYLRAGEPSDSIRGAACVETLQNVMNEVFSYSTEGQVPRMSNAQLRLLCRHALFVAIAYIAAVRLASDALLAFALEHMDPASATTYSLSIVLPAFALLLTTPTSDVPRIGGLAVPLLAVPWVSPAAMLDAIARL